MIIEFLIGVIKTWLYVSGAAYIVWLYFSLRTLSYKDSQNHYSLYGIWAKPRYYSEVFIGSALAALAWPLQLFVTIFNEH